MRLPRRTAALALGTALVLAPGLTGSAEETNAPAGEDGGSQDGTDDDVDDADDADDTDQGDDSGEEGGDY